MLFSVRYAVADRLLSLLIVLLLMDPQTHRLPPPLLILALRLRLCDPFFYDYNYIGTGAGMVSGNIYDHQIGLEVAEPDDPYRPNYSQSEADTFDMFAQATPKGGTSQAWPSHYFNDSYPCGTYPVPYCMNAVSAGAAEWKDNKPN